MIEQKKLTESLKKTYENNLEFLLKQQDQKEE